MPRNPADNRPLGIWPQGIELAALPYTPAIAAGGWLFVSGQTASDFKAGIAPEAKSTNVNLENQLGLQSRYIMTNLTKTVAAAGLDIDRDAVRIWQWHASPYPTLEEVRQGNNWARISTSAHVIERNKVMGEPRCASTTMAVKELLVKDALLEVDMICADDDEISIGVSAPDGVAVPLAGYSPAICRGDWVFISGELATDWQGDYGQPHHMGAVGAVAPEARVNPHLWYGSEVERQTDYTLSKISKIAEAAGSSLRRAVKAEVYIGDPADFAAMERAWKRWFPDNPPARTVIPYMGIGARGCRVEIGLTLLSNSSSKVIEPIHSDLVPRPFSHEPQAIKVGNLLFLSQQLPSDETGMLAEGLGVDHHFPYFGQPARQQMRYLVKNIEAICKAAGTSLENVVRRSCFHDQGVHFATAMDEWGASFPGLKPTSTTMILGGPLVVSGAHVMLDVVAWVPS